MTRARRTSLLALLLVVAGVANQSRSLRWGFALDDFIDQLALRRSGPSWGHRLPPWSLYDFGTRPKPGESFFDTGILPWWTDADFKARFFRPVTSLTIWADFALYDDWAPGYHLTSLALFGVFLALAFKLHRALGAPPGAALWALAFLSLSSFHLLPVGWIANRNTLLAALFTVATLLCVQQRCRAGKRRWLLAAALCFLCACASKESGLAAFPIVALYLFLFERDERLTPRRAAVRWLRSSTLWTFVALTAGYLTFYVVAGYGARSVVYPAPWTDPAGYLSRLPLLVPVGLLSLLFGFMSDLLAEYRHLIGPVVGVAVIVVPLASVVLFRVLGWTRLLVFAVGWIVFSLCVEAGGDLSDRLWMNAAVGSSLLIGLFLERLSPWRQRLADRRYPALVLAGVFLLTGIILPIPGMAWRNNFFVQIVGGDRAAVLSADIDRSAPPPRDVFLLNSPTPMLALEIASIWRVGRDDQDTRILPLQMGRRALAWTREDERTVTITSGSSPFLDDRFECVFRTTRTPRPPGTTYPTVAFTATIVAVEPGGVRAVRFEFNKPLDNPSYRFLVWQNGRLVRITPPAIGQTVQIPEVPRPSVYP